MRVGPYRHRLSLWEGEEGIGWNPSHELLTGHLSTIHGRETIREEG